MKITIQALQFFYFNNSSYTGSDYEWNVVSISFYYLEKSLHAFLPYGFSGMTMLQKKFKIVNCFFNWLLFDLKSQFGNMITVPEIICNLIQSTNIVLVAHSHSNICPAVLVTREISCVKMFKPQKWLVAEK